MSNANKISRYITTIDSTPSYAINILVVKPIAVSETFFFFIHTLYFFTSLNITFLPSERSRIEHFTFPFPLHLPKNVLKKQP